MLWQGEEAARPCQAARDQPWLDVHGSPCTVFGKFLEARADWKPILTCSTYKAVG